MRFLDVAAGSGALSIPAARLGARVLATDQSPVMLELLGQRASKELAAAGLRDVRVETITETTEFRSGKDLWDWLVWSNPIVEMVLGSLSLTDEERGAVQQGLEMLVRERAGGSSAARLTNPINIGLGTK